MSLKPWREVASPHKDVLEGSFQQSEFAADITQVASGSASEEYQDPEKFFSRTFITEGMRLLLVSVAKRLAGKGGDPVIQLQTAFGGGKTHTMLAVYHLAKQSIGSKKLTGISPILDDAGISELPVARVAVIDGNNLSPSHPNHCDGIPVNTLWGEIACQLLGQEGYEIIAASDKEGVSPGKKLLVELLLRAAPCVILIDELVAFIRQLELGQSYKAGTFDSNISFVQALTEALKAVPNAILLASLPESEVEAGGTMGQKALTSLEKYFGRVESVWKPVAAEEAFEIVRRRLFENAGDRALVEGISRQFSDFYREHAEKFPTETQSNDYFERLTRSYPIHPEIFDRLYEDWSTLDKFQRTRGVLQYLAIVIHRLWNSDNKDALIMPGSLPLDDAEVRNKSIHYLPQGWEPVIEREVDGSRSEPSDIDGHDTRLGGVQAARRAARTIFLGSAPSSPSQGVRGVEIERVLLGSAQPGQVPAVFEDALKRLRDRLSYLYSENDRVWLDTKPNLRREMESRKQHVADRDELYPQLKTRIERSFGRNHQFSGIHVFTSSADIPDDYGTGPRLVVLRPESGFSRSETNAGTAAAVEILERRGEQPRQKRNRLIFLAPDADVIGRLKDQARTFIAWSSIVSDIESGKLNQDLSHLNQAKASRDSADKALSQVIRETYKWLLVPREEFIKDKPTLSWEHAPIASSAPNVIQAIEEKLREEEWVIYDWAPIHLKNILSQFYLKDGVSEVSAQKVWQDTCQFLYLPRLVNNHVFENAITEGVKTQDYFAFSAGKDGDRYLGFAFGSGLISTLSESSLLIERNAASEYEAKNQPVRQDDAPLAEPPDDSEVPIEGEVPDPGTPRTEAVSTRFWGSTKVDPVRAAMDFGKVVEEVVGHFTSELGVEVKISVEIEANTKKGFSESLQRTVKENCDVLRFDAAEFEK